MATQALERHELDLAQSRGTLVLVWQNPASHRFVKVGQLDALPHGRFAFQYLASAWSDPEFNPLLEFPERDVAYISDEIPAFFANRILSSDRPHYAQYLEWLGVEGFGVDDVPFEVLARTGGSRATDTFHVVDLPLDSEQAFRSRFFVSGIRHQVNADAVVRNLRQGGELRLHLDEDNAVNPKAVLIDTTDGQTVGYVPDWLCADVHARIKDNWAFSAVAERVNPDAPPHLRVLCLIDARPA
jgi:hypothetical protein